MGGSTGSMGAVEDRILGMLYGCAIGDSFGMPSEMWTPSRIRERFGAVDSFVDSPVENEISGGFKAGETTDDTIVAFISAEALIRTSGNINPLDIVHSIEQWSIDNPKSKTIVGPSTRLAFDAIHSGVPVEEAGRQGETNGAGTRVAPVGVIVNSSDTETLCRKVQNVCMATHNTSAALSGACAIAAAVAHGIEGGCLEDMVQVVLEAAEYGSHLGREIPAPLVSERIKYSLNLSGSVKDDIEFMKRQYELIGSGLPMIQAAPTAIAIAYRCGGDLMRACRLAANMGGDTDTVAAMAGMVVGAHVGASRVDCSAKELVSRVNGHPFEAVAHGLFELRRSLIG